MKEIKDTLDRIFKKLEDIDNKQDFMNEVQVRHEHSLKEHMRRTELLEDEVKPIKKHVEQVRGAGKLLAVLATISTIAGAIFLVIK